MQATTAPLLDEGFRRHGESKKQASDEVGKGWSNEGKERFNKLFKTVKRDRRNHPDFFDMWIKIERERLGKQTTSKRARSDTVVRTKHELFSDSEEETDEVAGSGASVTKRQRNNAVARSVTEHVNFLESGNTQGY